MPELKISRVVEVSSEDPQFPASNLLTGGEWRCLGTEEDAWVLLQLAEPAYITNIGFHVVNEVASIEVKVGNRVSNSKEMKDLLDPITNNESSIKVIEVSEDDFTEEVLKEKFDQVKIKMGKSANGLVNYGVSRFSLNGLTKLSLWEAAERGTKAEIMELKSRQKCQDEEFSRMRDEEIKLIKEKYEKKIDESRELFKLQINAKEKDLTEHESLEKEIRSKLLQSLSVPVPEEKVPECPACMEKMKPPLQIFNCPNGHLICSDCKPNVPGNRCTDCKIPYAGRANGAEKIVRSLMNLD